MTDSIFALLSKRFTIKPNDLTDKIVSVLDRNAPHCWHAIERDRLPSELLISHLDESMFDQFVAAVLYTSDQEAFEAGVRAFHDGTRWYENPYPSGSVAAYRWDQGHTSVRVPA